MSERLGAGKLAVIDNQINQATATLRLYTLSQPAQEPETASTRVTLRQH